MGFYASAKKVLAGADHYCDAVIGGLIGLGSRLSGGSVYIYVVLGGRLERFA